MATSKLEENSVVYTLFPRVDCEEEFVTTFLRNYANESYAKLAVYLTKYVWQNTAFNLKVVQDVLKGAHLQGLTVFDDSIDDEWFIVFLLIELTKRDNDLVVTIEDNDGQFLLIEAAEYLPHWVNPKNSENRVYLYRGAIHLIPLEVSDCSNVKDCVQMVRRNCSSTRCSEEIQAAIYRRIKEFPQKIEVLKQSTRCYLPAAIVVLLREDSSLISQAVKAFYTRDVIDAKVCKAMKHFPPESRVMTNVTLTRCMYSQLMCQKYTPDSKVGWNIPPQKSTNFKAYDLGMKIATGFEILVSICNFSDELRTSSSFDNRLWNQFLESLERNGYFRNLLKGSKDYNVSLNAARVYFTNLVNHNELDDSTQLSTAKKVLKILERTEVDYDSLKADESNLESEDSDEWMTIEPDDLETLLKRQFNIEDEENLAQLTSDIPNAMKSFVNYNKSGIEGAEIPKNRYENKPENVTDEVRFDVDKFGEALSSILHLRVPQSDTDDSSSGMSDYTEDSSDSDDELRLLDRNLRLRKENETYKQIEKAAEENELNTNMELYMEAMDKELAETNVGLSFERKKPPLAEQEEDSDDSSYVPVDVDLTALKNILESYESQNGLPGPAGNILSSMGIHLPQNSDNSTQ